jgi:hypothetical protein
MCGCSSKWGAAAALFMLGACHSKGTALRSQDAAHFLHEACGITFTQDPQVLPDASVVPRPGSPVVASAKVVLPEGDVEAALASLRNNRTLHSRGQSATRYSYESWPDARPVKSCELDTSLHVLYFSYME